MVVAGKADISCLIREFSVFFKEKISIRDGLEVKLGLAAIGGAGGGEGKRA